MFLSNEEILKMINITIDDMNSNEEYTEVIYPFGKAGVIQKLFEIRLLRTIQKYYPDYEVYHPDDNSSLPDIYSKKFNNGFELKTTLGWYSHGKRNSVAWSNGTIQTKTELFLLLDTELNKDKNYLILNNVYIGEVSFKDDWRVHGAGMYIGQSKIKELCECVYHRDEQ